MYKFTFLADLHYYSKTLGTSGRAYELRSGSDQKCLAESGAIIDAAFNHLARSDTRAVLLAGDLTNDGEMVCHRELREKLYALAEKKPVYLITNTHDWCCDGNPRRFTGARVTHDVPTMPHTGIHDFYYDFGGRQAIAEYRTHLGISSYVIPLAEKIWLLALCDDQNGRGKAGYTEPHFQWIEEQLRRAKEQGCLVLGMQHHLLLPHVHPLLTGGCCVGDREAVTARLADAGLRYMFVGHSHLQRTDRYRSPAGNELTEVNVGALSGYPVPMVQVTVTDDLQVHPGPCLQFTAAVAVCRVPGGFCPEAGRLAAARAQVAASVSIGKAVVSFAAHRHGEGLATNAAAFGVGSVCGRPGSGRTGGSADSALFGVDPAAIYGRLRPSGGQG